MTWAAHRCTICGQPPGQHIHTPGRYAELLRKGEQASKPESLDAPEPLPRILVLGAGGIIGQHIERAYPDLSFVRSRREAALDSRDSVRRVLDERRPTSIINLAGENRVDIVQGNSQGTAPINCGLPMWAAEWCDENDAFLVQVSTQGIFSGDHAPYHPSDTPHPHTEYGAQKVEAEQRVAAFRNWMIARVTFVLGVRPRDSGRTNPLEQMFSLPEQKQVNDRFFSPSFATDVALHLTGLAAAPVAGLILHLGLPIRVSRYDIAVLANPDARIKAVSDNDFLGATRPFDTTYAAGSLWVQTLIEGINSARRQWEALHVRPHPG